MRFLQIVVTKTAIGRFKLTVMGLNDKGQGETLLDFKGEFCAMLWKLFRLMPKLKAYRPEEDICKPAPDTWKAANKCRPT